MMSYGTRDLLRAEGAAAYRAGLAVAECPPFKLDEMAREWRQGWWDEYRRRSLAPIKQPEGKR